jgi:glycosyl transferase family 1
VPLRMCLVTHESNAGREHGGIWEALARRFDLTVVYVEGGWPQHLDDLGRGGDDPHGYDVVMFQVKFRHLVRRPPFDWGSYAGARIMLDLDAFQNYSAMISRQYLGRWPGVFRANGFHVLVCTGGQVRDRFLEDGVHAVWIPKGYDARRIADLGDDVREARYGYFGRLYPARQRMLGRLERSGVPVERVSCSYGDLNRYLNRFDAVLICNMALLGARQVPARVLRKLPAPLLRERPGPEPMIKNFEVAAAGAAPVCDALPDLDALGFRDGETMVSYRSFDELVENVRHYDREPDRLREIGRRAATFVAEHHTWDHRTAQFEQLVASGSYLPPG